MKLISWNVNGFRAVLKKDFEQTFDELDADIFAIQETKAQEEQISFKREDYFQYFSSAKRKGYSGTCVYTKVEPLCVIKNIFSNDEKAKDSDKQLLDDEGRIVALEFKNFWFVCCYTPNAKNELARINERLKWGQQFKNFLKELESGNRCSTSKKTKPVIVCGDLNVAHQEIDLRNPKSNRGNAGFSDEEREDFTELLNSGFVDSFRYLYPDKKDAYSWWSYRFNARSKNIGWRIDYFLVSEFAKEKIKDSKILKDVYGSDHCPVELDIDI